jgi:hypothetical protein
VKTLTTLDLRSGFDVVLSTEPLKAGSKDSLRFQNEEANGPFKNALIGTDKDTYKIGLRNFISKDFFYCGCIRFPRWALQQQPGIRARGKTDAHFIGNRSISVQALAP